MSYRCRRCGAEFDASLFEFGITFRCDCGEIVGPGHTLDLGAPEAADADTPAFSRSGDDTGLLRALESGLEEAIEHEEADYRQLQRAADRISFLIVASDYPEIDLLIERRNLRRLCGRLFPDRMGLFDHVYEARFRRLWEQFRV